MSRELSANQAPFVVSCPDCDVSKDVDDPNEALAFYRRHHRLTGHSAEWDRAALDPGDVGDVPTDGDLKSVMWELDSQYEDGIPIGVITAVRSKQGITIQQTLEDIEDLRMSGALFEPRDDHLRPF